MSRKLAFTQRKHSRQLYWFAGYTIEALTKHTHQLEPIILYLFHQAVIIVDSIAFEKERQGSDLIKCELMSDRMNSRISSSFQVQNSPAAGLSQNNRTNLHKRSTWRRQISNAGAQRFMGFIGFIRFIVGSKGGVCRGYGCDGRCCGGWLF